MASLIPIPTTRVGDYFVRQRLVRQVQGDQVGLFQLQNQVSTGRRIIRPSDDAPAALRAIALQRTIHRKEQAERNLAGSRYVLGGAETALDSVSTVLNDVRGAAVESVSNLSSDASRLAAIEAIDRALASLITSGNANYNGRYLFAGSRTSVSPFAQTDQFVQYNGNEKNLQNYVDLEQLFTTNLPGTEVFGGISGEVRGSTDLNPGLTLDTLLTSVNGGEGIDTNSAISVNVSNGSTTTSSIIDLSGAVTIGDVVRRIEAGTSGVTVRIANNGLTLQTNNGTDTVRVSEVASGRAAKELGIFTSSSTVATTSITGLGLNPVAEKTTSLADLFGTKASLRLPSTGANNDLIVTAAVNGTALNGVAVQFVSGATAGNEVATFSAGTLTVQIESGVTTAQQVAAAINAEGTFTAAVDKRDANSSTLAGTGVVFDNNFTGLVTAGGSGEALDTASGLVLTNGGQTVALDISTAKTLEDLFNLINGAKIGLAAEINAAGDGINVRSLLSGADFTIGENGGTTATQLGIRTYTGSTQLADLNRGVGVPSNDLQDNSFPTFTTDLVITARNGSLLTVPVADLAGADSLTDVATLINGLVANHDGATIVTASVTPDGRGIRLVDQSTTTTSDLEVLGNATAEALGFVSPGAVNVADGTPDVDGFLSLNSYRHTQADDFVIVASDGAELWIDATGATTIQDIIDRVNNHPRNNNGTTAVQAQLATNGNGIELVDFSAGTGDLTVRAAEGSEFAQYLGFIPPGQTEATSATGTLISEDRNTLEVDSVFNTLIRLRQALENSDAEAIGRAVERLDVDLQRATFARGEIGSRLQTLDVVQTRLENETVQLKSALSNEIDVDLVEAISNLTARQFSLQASLQTAASILNLSILDYL